LFSGGMVGARRGRLKPTSFNRAAALQRRNAQCTIKTPPVPPRFNRAAALQRRNVKRWLCEVRGALHASIGPPLFSGGMPRKAEDLRRVPEFKWGRRSSAAECYIWAYDSTAPANASIGPPLFSGGMAAPRAAPPHSETR